jgi:hypothetical protein
VAFSRIRLVRMRIDAHAHYRSDAIALFGLGD